MCILCYLSNLRHLVKFTNYKFAQQQFANTLNRIFNEVLSTSQYFKMLFVYSASRRKTFDQQSGPAPWGGIPGPCPPQTRIVPLPKRGLCPSPSEDCASKKLTGLVLLECNSRPETPKILVITPELVSKNCFFVDFAVKTVCFVVSSQNS